MSDKIEQRINKTIASLDGLIPAEPKPFLLTRIHAALYPQAIQSTWERIAAYIKKPAIAGLTIVTVLILNIAVFNARHLLTSGRQISASSKYDFSLNVSSMYDTENQEP